MPPSITIPRGATLSQLVQRYNRQQGTRLTVAEVARKNGIANPNHIIAGRPLRFTDGFEPARTSTGGTTTGRTTGGTTGATSTSTTALRDGGGYGGTQRLAQDAIDFARRLGFAAGSQKRGTLYRNGRVLSGPTSDHHREQRSSYAVDFPARGARGDQLARALARKYGFTGNGAGSYAPRYLRIGGRTYRVQLLWRVAGHYDHVHVGFRRVR